MYEYKEKLLVPLRGLVGFSSLPLTCHCVQIRRKWKITLQLLVVLTAWTKPRVRCPILCRDLRMLVGVLSSHWATIDMVDELPELSLPDGAWLSQLHQHAIFQASKDLAPYTTKPSAMAIRNADILVAFGRSIRMASLLEAKYLSDKTNDTEQPFEGTYKLITSPTLNFDIVSLELNSTGKLLAVIGTHRVAIVVLPRSGALTSATKPKIVANHVSGEIGVKATDVGPFYHHERMGSRGRIAQVKWHPWGEMGTSLLVLTREGTLREYNVASDVEEPAQMLSLIPDSAAHPTLTPTNKARRSRTPSSIANRSRRSTSRVAFDNDSDSDGDNDAFGDESFHTASSSIRSSPVSSRSAVTFTLGIDPRTNEETEQDVSPANWLPLTVFCLCSNGDLFAVCPFMPKNAIVPTQYLHSLSSYQAMTLARGTCRASPTIRNLQARYVSSLLKQASSLQTESEAEHSPKSRRAMSTTPMSVDGDRTSIEPEEINKNTYASVRAPLSSHFPQEVTCQGPFLLSPAPHELSEEVESISADLFYAHISSKERALDIFGIASTNGKVDLCLLMDAIMPSWNVREPQVRSKAKSGRYAFSDSDDEIDENFDTQSVAEQLPTLLVYESIDLGVLTTIHGDVSAIEKQLKDAPMRFVLDPLYSDVIYVYHFAGAHALGFSAWTQEITSAMAADAAQQSHREADTESAVVRALHHQTPSDIAWIVKTIPEDGIQAGQLVNSICGFSIITDLYLCYSFLALAQSGSLVTLELALRVKDYEGIEDADRSKSKDALTLEEATVPPAYTSLLGDGPAFTPPAPFKTFQGLPSQPKIASQVSKDELRVTPHTLRTLATTVQGLREQMRDIVRGGNTVQSRLELQMEEFKRQLQKLSDVQQRIERQSSSEGRANLDARLKKVFARQEDIVRRSDRLLQRLLDHHSPELSIYEQRWLQELQRLQAQVGDTSQSLSNQAEATGLSARVNALAYQLDLLKPELQEAQRRNQSEEKQNNFGSKQLESIEAMLATQAKILSSDRDKLLKLSVAVRNQSRTAKVL